MSENKKKDSNDKSQNPKDGVQDSSPSDHENNGSTKKSHQVMNDNSKKDIIDKNSNHAPRDNA